VDRNAATNAISIRFRRSLHQRGQPADFSLLVVVEECNPITSSRIDTQVSRCSNSGMDSLDVPYSERALLSEAFHNLRSIVGRPIVDNDNFEGLAW
jgi:hypothetical protein